MEFIKIKTSTSWIIDFWWKPDMSKIPKKGSLLRFCNIYICIYNIYIKKKYCNCFCVLLWCKTFRYFTGFQSYLLSLSFANTPTVPIFVLVSRIESICPGFYICHQKKFHIYIIFHQQCKTINLRVIHTLNATKNNTFELNKNVILKTFHSNVQVLFRETYIWFDYKQPFENIKTESNSLDTWIIISEFINGN